jgi:ATP-dependent RNA helicase SUPV3L1/SUV3
MKSRRLLAAPGGSRVTAQFGETGECEPFDEEIVERVEAHEFETIEAVQWRNAELKFASLEALVASLETPPNRNGCCACAALTTNWCCAERWMIPICMDRVRTPEDVRRVWEACQLPDFRKLSKDEHVQLALRIANYIVTPKGRVPSTWVSAEIEKLDRTAGDLDVLQSRLAHIRTWTYAASRSDWLEDADDWRAKTREVEDKLSDALHEALTQRFIDRRTSALLKGLKREDALLAGITEDGEVSVEGHFVGQLDGLEFKPDPRTSSGLEGRAVRNAALRALRPEVSRRLAQIAHAPDDEITLGRDGRVHLGRAAVAKLTQGAPVLKPRLELIGGEHANSDIELNAARERLELWLAQQVAHDLRPLMALENAWREGRLPPDARGLAFRLIENAGALDRAGEDLAHMSEFACNALRRYGVRIGRHTVFLPALVKPRAAHTLALLWRAAYPDAEQSLFLARPGALSAPLESKRSWGECAAAGYRACGRIAVRLDLVEKLAEAIESEAAPNDASLARLIGRPVRELASVLESLGYRQAPQKRARPKAGAALRRAARAKRARLPTTRSPRSPICFRPQTDLRAVVEAGRLERATAHRCVALPGAFHQNACGGRAPRH